MRLRKELRVCRESPRSSARRALMSVRSLSSAGPNSGRVPRFRRLAIVLITMALGGCEPYARARFLLPQPPSPVESHVREAFEFADSLASVHQLRYRSQPDTARYYVWQRRGTSLKLEHDGKTRISFELHQIGAKGFRDDGRDLLEALQRTVQARYGVSCTEELVESYTGQRDAVWVCWPNALVYERGVAAVGLVGHLPWMEERWRLVDERRTRELVDLD